MRSDVRSEQPDAELKKNFVRRWFDSRNEKPDAEMRSAAAALGIDLDVPRRCIACRIKASGFSILDGLSEEAAADKKLRTVIAGDDPQNLTVRDALERFYFVTELKDDRIEELLARAVKKLGPDGGGLSVSFGVSSSVYTRGMMLDAAAEATRALSAANGGTIHFYDSTDIESMVRHIPEKTKSAFMAKVMCGYSDKELRDAMDLLRTYYESDGSLSDASSRLYLHKNTLQYKLNRIFKRTGLNPRSMKDALKFRMAAAFYFEPKE